MFPLTLLLENQAKKATAPLCLIPSFLIPHPREHICVGQLDGISAGKLVIDGFQFMEKENKVMLHSSLLARQEIVPS